MTAGRPRARVWGAAAAALLVLGGSAPAVAAPAAPAAPSAGDEPIPVAVVVPLVVPLDAPPILGAAELAAWTAPGGLLAERLDAVTGTAAALAIDPRIPASIRLLGTDAPDSAVQWLTRLEALQNDSFALGWADADVAGLVRVGRGDLAAPLSLQFAVDPGRFEGLPAPDPSASITAAEDDPAPTDSPGPAPTEEPDGPALPTDEQLLAVPVSLEDAVWAAETSPELELLGVGEDSYLVDAELSALADQALAPATAAEARGSLIAAIEESLAPSSLLGLSRAVLDEPVELRALLLALSSDSRIRLVDLDEYLQIAPVYAGIIIGQNGGTEPDPQEERDALLQQLADAADAEAVIAAVTPDSGAFLAERRLELLRALAVGRAETEPEAAEAFLEGSRALAGAVQLADSSDLLVLSNSTGLPVTISNALDVPATVRLNARPLRPLLRIQDVPQTVTIEPGSSRTVYLPAQAVTNGQVSVLLSLTTPSGAPLGPERTVRVDLQAQWETVGIVVLALLAVAFALGIVRNIVRRRRTAASATAEPHDG